MEHIHASGLTRSHKAPGFHQIPLEALQCLADRFDLGRMQRTPGTCWYDNKEKSLTDDDFYRQTLNNAMEHLSKLMNGDFSEDDEWGHLGAIMWMCAVRAWRYKRLGQNAANVQQAVEQNIQQKAAVRGHVGLGETVYPVDERSGAIRGTSVPMSSTQVRVSPRPIESER